MFSSRDAFIVKELEKSLLEKEEEIKALRKALEDVEFTIENLVREQLQKENQSNEIKEALG